MSTYLYKALIAAGAEEDKAAEVAKEINRCRGDISEMKSDIKALKMSCSLAWVCWWRWDSLIGSRDEHSF